MARKAIRTTGLHETIANLETLANISNIYALERRAIYLGAKVVIEGMLEELSALKITRYYGTDQKMRYAWPEEAEALIDSCGIAKMITDETVNTKVGFDGYYTAGNGERYPVPLIANSINAGTSFMHAQPFIDQTVRKTEKAALKVMEQDFNNSAKNIMK